MYVFMLLPALLLSTADPAALIGQRLLIRSGYRDIYGSAHHRDWMWSTRSVNNITVSGKGQLKHSSASQGEIICFQTTSALDMVIGETGNGYRDSTDVDDESRLLDRFTRAIVFAKPNLVIVYDRLVARQPETFQYWLHALNQFEIDDRQRVTVRAGAVGCPIQFLAPVDLQMTQTDQYDPNPRGRVKLREWHLTATTIDASKRIEFITVMRPHRDGEIVPSEVKLDRLNGGYVLTAGLTRGQLVALLSSDDVAKLQTEGLTGTGNIVVQLRDDQGNALETIAQR